MKIKEVKRTSSSHVYCGPMAVAAITGRDTARVENMFATEIKKRNPWRKKPSRVGATDLKDNGSVLMRCGYTMVSGFINGSPGWSGRTIEDWAAKAASDGGPVAKTWYFIGTNNHWLAFRDDFLVDTFSKGVPVPVHKHPERNRVLRSVYKVVRKK